jgi:hypothetical protein
VSSVITNDAMNHRWLSVIVAAALAEDDVDDT